MDDLEISVSAIDRIITVNGDGYRCGDDFPNLDANLVAMHWAPKSQGRTNGTAEYHKGSGVGFDDFDRVAPFYQAWKVVKGKTAAAAIVEEARVRAAEEAAKLEQEAEMQRAVAEAEAMSAAENPEPSLRERIEALEKIIAGGKP